MFQLTPRQMEAQQLLAGPATHIMLGGGSRSGKTLLLTRAVATRAIKAPESRHAILRLRFNHVKASIVLDTFPKVMKLCYPNIRYTMDKTDWYATLHHNDSQIWFGGLDDKQRTEKILGQEHATIYLNEISQLPFSSKEMAFTRLAQKVEYELEGEKRLLKTRMYYDCVSGDTVLPGQTKTIAELASDGKPILALTTHGWVWSSPPWMNGTGMLYEIQTENGKHIKVTASHRFWTHRGWVRVDQLTIGQQILCTDEHHYPDDVVGGHELMRKAQDSQESYCRCHRQYDEQFHPAEVHDLAGLASSSCAAAHTPNVCCHGGQGSRKCRLHPLSTQHTPRTRECRGLLCPKCGDQFSYKTIPCGWPVCGSSQQRCPFVLRPPVKSDQSLLGARIQSALQVSCCGLSCSEAGHRVYATCKSSSHYTHVQPQSHDQSPLASTIHAILDSPQSASFDTPSIERCYYETVVAMSPATTNAFYTIEVPIVNHYIANGIVNHNCNPPKKSHWSYRLFREKRDPETKLPLQDPDNYAYMQINPHHNQANLDAEYIKGLESLTPRMRKRFLEGDFSDDVANGLFSGDIIDVYRKTDGKLPDMVRIVVGVDPSGAGDEENAHNDAIGIVVGGLGTDGVAYLLEDCTVKAGPATWGKIATSAFDRHQADMIVGEVNFGGAMVGFVVQTARARTPYKAVTASRGKVVRAEPFSSLYEQGKCRHAGYFPELEDEMAEFTTNGYCGADSPNRADAWFWVLTELFSGIVNPRKAETAVPAGAFKFTPMNSGMGY